MQWKHGGIESAAARSTYSPEKGEGPLGRARAEKVTKMVTFSD